MPKHHVGTEAVGAAVLQPKAKLPALLKMEGEREQEQDRARWRISPQVREKQAHSPAERSLERRDEMTVARTTMLAMKMGGNKGKGWREMLEEESTTTKNWS